MISEGFVTNGATVYISSRDAKACDKAVEELNALGKGKAYAITANFYEEDECKKLADELTKRENSESSKRASSTLCPYVVVVYRKLLDLIKFPHHSLKNRTPCFGE
jgi:hypothetical protein